MPYRLRPSVLTASEMAVPLHDGAHAQKPPASPPAPPETPPEVPTPGTPPPRTPPAPQASPAEPLAPDGSLPSLHSEDGAERALVMVAAMRSRAALAAIFGIQLAAGGVAAFASAGHARSSAAAFLQQARSMELAQLGAEDAAAGLAARRDVRDLAQTLAADQSNIGDELKDIARGKGVTLPPDPDPSGTLALDALRAAGGPSLDADYLRQETEADRNAITLYRRAAGSDDEDIRAFAQRTLPLLEQHLASAQRLRDRSARWSPHDL